MVHCVHTCLRFHTFTTPDCPVVKVPLDARERSSCTSNYSDSAFPRLRFHFKKHSGHNDLLGPKADVQFPHLWFSTLTASVCNTDATKHTTRGLLGRYPRRRDDDDKYDTRCLRLNNNEMTSLTGFSDLLTSLLVQPDALRWLDLSFNKLPNIDPVSDTNTISLI